MKKVNKKKKTPNSYSKIFPFLILIASLFMTIGYASINSLTADITGEVLANAQNGIFITDVVYESNKNADIVNSKIKSFNKTILNSTVVLSEDNENSFITYKVTVYNSTDDLYAFEDVKYIVDEQIYDNENISFELIGLENMTLLPSKKSITFSIKFYYKDKTNIVDNTLNSYLNFSFKQAHSVKYVDIDDSNLPKYVLTKNDLKIDFGNSNYRGMKVFIDDSLVTNYTYMNNILVVSNVTGDVTIQPVNNTCLVTFDTNMNMSDYASITGFEVEEKTEAAGDYYRASFSKTEGTKDEWYRILFPEYDYKVGATYRVRIKTRLQEITSLYKMQLRHSAIKNDYDTDGREFVELKDDEIGVWNEYVLTRTFTANTIIQDGKTYELSPRIELYTGNLKLSDGISKISLTLDYKDVYVGEISTLEYNYGNRLNTLPTPTRDGYIFEGWFTEPEGGTKIDSSTIVTNENITYYAHWVSAVEKAIITFDTNMDVSKYVRTDGFDIEEKTDQDGKFYRASFQKTEGTTDDWYKIDFEKYNYTLGATYEIRIKIRMQSVVGDVTGDIRHAAIKNDWGTDGKKIVKFTSGTIGKWKKYTLVRTFNSSTLVQDGTSYSLSPHIEIYTNNLTLAGGIKEKSLTFDFKDVYVSEITTKIVNYGSKLGTLPVPIRDDYVFKGWFTEPEGGTKVTSSTIVDFSTATYYAQWEPEEN